MIGSQQSWECAETLSGCWQCGVKLPKLGVSDAPGLGLSAMLMEGTALDCLLNDRCQQRPTSSKSQVADVCWLTAEKDDDTEISQSANVDTHGTCAPFWAPRSAVICSTHQAETTGSGCHFETKTNVISAIFLLVGWPMIPPDPQRATVTPLYKGWITHLHAF